MTLWLLWKLPDLFNHQWGNISLPAEAVRTGGAVIGFAVGLALNWEVAKEYRNTPSLWWAHLALAVYSGVFLVRMIVESPLTDLIEPGFYRSPLHGLWQHIFSFISKFALIAGLALMCYAYHRVGLGFRLARRDYLTMAGIVALLAALLVFRGQLSQAQSPYLTGRYLQLAGLFQLALMAALSVALHRMIVQMGGGKLKVALRFLALHAVASSALVLAEAINDAYSPELSPALGLPLGLGWQANLWFPALSAAYRLQLTISAAREIELLEREKAGTGMLPNRPLSFPPARSIETEEV